MEPDKKDGFKSFGEWLMYVRRASLGGERHSRLKTTGHMETGDDAQGGFLCPEEWAERILSIAMENAIVRPRAAVLSTKTDSLKIRRLVESTRASSYFGGITFTWISEAADKTSYITKPTLGLLELTPHKLVGGCYVANELEADYENFGMFMELSFGRALRFEEDYYYIWGNGAGQPQGIVNAAATISHARTNNASSPIIQDLAEMAERLLPGSWPTAVWLMHPETLGALTTDATNGGNVGGILDLSGVACMGRPIIITEKCAAAGSVGDVILADFTHYVIADRSLEISASREVPGSYGFITDETFWRVVLRTDGQPIMDAAVTPKNGTDTLSAFVILTTAS